ncbi:hypothetical protein [Thiothrix lacustris]|uniref:Uncharacterized protein n=1 Tax=Thiothrix lacustris TaxID=525917 RepID=A0ABY9MRZ6_9GAMM|nr:hypothetical protein [Thiothrix lacustris]WML91303.1 hypothetical protein RCF98_02865 [Thiothrix lacustris]WMP18158.1 hypothetical protein RCS87_03620 [Thiothrix lacustris]
MFTDITSRHPDMTSASLDVIIMLAGAFLLGFLLCYFRSRSSQGE